jgi:hypothetical protein
MADNSSLVKLEDFITETLTQIIKGVKNANLVAEENGAVINPENAFRSNNGDILIDNSYSFKVVQEINFDIAITAAEKSDTKGGVGVFVSIIGIGAQLKDSMENSTMSRIKFSVPVKLPSKRANTK